MNEHGFVKAVHRKLPPSVYKWKIHDTYTGGVPDAMYAGPAGALFVEYKYIPKLPSREDTIIKTGLSPLQIAWLERMCSYKILVAVIIGSNLGGLILTNQEWEKELKNKDFIEHGLPTQEVAEWIGKTLLGIQDGTGCVLSGRKPTKTVGKEKTN